jgi:DMSO/TMAO reductase YedYZ molybdopterin-dependent catalytic subunit
MSDNFFNRAVDRVTKLRQSTHHTPADPRTDRVPPGQHLTSGFPVLHYGGVPRFDPARWDFRAYGLVTTPLMLTWADFSKLPTVREVVDIHCVTTWSTSPSWSSLPPKPASSSPTASRDSPPACRFR